MSRFLEEFLTSDTLLGTRELIRYMMLGMPQRPRELLYMVGSSTEATDEERALHHGDHRMSCPMSGGLQDEDVPW